MPGGSYTLIDAVQWQYEAVFSSPEYGYDLTIAQLQHRLLIDPGCTPVSREWRPLRADLQKQCEEALINNIVQFVNTDLSMIDLRSMTMTKTGQFE